MESRSIFARLASSRSYGLTLFSDIINQRSALSHSCLLSMQHFLTLPTVLCRMALLAFSRSRKWRLRLASTSLTMERHLSRRAQDICLATLKQVSKHNKGNGGSGPAVQSEQLGKQSNLYQLHFFFFSPSTCFPHTSSTLLVDNYITILGSTTIRVELRFV